MLCCDDEGGDRASERQIMDLAADQVRAVESGETVAITVQQTPCVLSSISHPSPRRLPQSDIRLTLRQSAMSNHAMITGRAVDS
jgi:antitoxin (DNA-binding transcriptional repressor) of toxin-antitoxin stability system